MKPFLKPFFYICFFSVFLCSCEYENSGIYEQEVNKDVTAPEIQVVELNLNEDTLLLYDSKQINFRFRSNDIQKISSVNLYMDNTIIETVKNENGYFSLNYSSLSIGTHKLIIEIVTKSGTNSIADKLGSEGFILRSKEWVVIIVKPIQWPGEVITEITNGYLKMQWPEYQSPLLKKYKIYYNCNKVYGSQDFEIGQTTKNEFIDSSYIGQGGKYIIKVLTYPELIVPAKVKYITKEFPQLSFIYNDNNTYKISWSKSKYMNSVDSYIVKSYKFPEPIKILKSTVNPNDTTYIIDDGYFGDSKEYRLYLIPKSKKHFYCSDDHYNTINCELGIPFPNLNVYLNRVHQINSDDLFFIRNDSLTRYSTSTNLVVQQRNYSSISDFYYLSINKCSNYLTAISNPYTNILRVSLNDLNSYKVSNIPYIRYYTCPAISNTGIGIIEGNDNFLYYYNFNNDSILGKYAYDKSFVANTKISPNGNYFLRNLGYIGGDIRYKLVEFKNSTFRVVNEESYLSFTRSIGFIPNELEQMYMWYGSTFYIKKCSDFTTLYEFNLQDESIINFDFYNNEFLSYKGYHLYVRNLKNGAIIKDIPIGFQAGSSDYRLLLMNHALYYFNGIKNCLKYNLN
ncbi:MAG: hypothetical protein EHM93_02790 [Bacteroidales bacterium]|nr:MAG: hypothetical protein EHM93_02790 [Bacteroidales bacterium]